MKKPPQLIKSLILILFFIGASVWGLYFSAPPKFLTVSFLDVGSGDAILIRTPDNFKIMIDGGPSNKVLNHLGNNLGPIDRSIDLLILTHPHQDHVLGALNILERYDVKKVFGTGVIHTGDYYISFLEKVKTKKIDFTPAEQGEVLRYGDLEIEVYYPFESLAGKKVASLNNSSIVFKARYGKNSFLFMGDAESEVGQKLLKSGLDLRADVLKVAHQGSKNGAQNVKGFLDKVKPQYAIIPVGENQYGHPHKETLDILDQKGIKVFRTDRAGSINIQSDGDKAWIKNGE